MHKPPERKKFKGSSRGSNFLKLKMTIAQYHVFHHPINAGLSREAFDHSVPKHLRYD